MYRYPWLYDVLVSYKKGGRVVLDMFNLPTTTPYCLGSSLTLIYHYRMGDGIMQ